MVGLVRDHNALLTRDRAVIAAALAIVTLLSWLYLYLQMRPMAEMAGLMPATFAPWSAADFALNFLLWWVMMPAMMLPSAAPMIMTCATITRPKRERREPFVPTAVFVAGYLIAWGVFGAVATYAQAVSDFVNRLLWMAVIAAFVLIEKLLPAGQWIARAGGIVMLALSLYLVLQH
jgi:predicted metal-binding membrane protein